MPPLANSTLFVALDVETTGPRPGTDSLLSVGACAVMKEGPTPEECKFYIELKPTSLDYYHDAIRVGASELDALKPVVKTPRLCPRNPYFEPKTTLVYLQDSDLCVYAPTAMRRFLKWLEEVSRYRPLMPVVDTAFFDPGWLNYVFAEYGRMFPPFGHKGLDLRSYWAGVKGDPNAKLSSVGYTGVNEREHHAGYDACHLAGIAQMVLYGGDQRSV